MASLQELEDQAAKDLQARTEIRKALRILIDRGYSELEIEDFIWEVFEEIQSEDSD